MNIAPGTIVGGDFRVERGLAVGGMGAVYVALQLSTGKRRAIKLMRPELVRVDKLRARFAQEARVGAHVASEHVAEVLGAGIDENLDAPWIAMELLDGENLAVHLQRRGFLAPDETRIVMEQAGHAVAAAHAAGIVHRDLKPENIFVARAHQVGTPFLIKVLDFGVAKLLSEAQASSPDSAALGTPRWMAPEQTDGTAAISPAADVWALGLIAFYLLTGKDYWLTSNVGPPSIPRLLREILFEPMAPASERAKALGVGALPDGFDPWFARCTARDPTARFPNAGPCIAELSRTLGGLGAPTTGKTIPMTAAMAEPATLLMVGGASPQAASIDVGLVAEGVRGREPPRSRGARIWVGAGLLAVVCALTLAGVGVYLGSDLSGADPSRNSEKRQKPSDGEALRERDPDAAASAIAEVAPSLAVSSSSRGAEAPTRSIGSAKEELRFNELRLLAESQPLPPLPGTALPIETIAARELSFERELEGAQPYRGTLRIAPVGRGYLSVWSFDGPRASTVGMGLRVGNVAAFGCAEVGYFGISAFDIVEDGLQGLVMSSTRPGAIYSQSLVGSSSLNGVYRLYTDREDPPIGTALLKRDGERVEVSFQLPDGVYTGVGLVQGERVFIAWNLVTLTADLVLYDIDELRWTGRFESTGLISRGKEIAVVRPPAVAP